MVISGCTLPSGRKKRIMVACVTFETSKVVEPALYYEINKAHIIHYVKDPTSENGMIYDSFCQRVCEMLREESPREVEVVIHNERVSDFSAMLRTVLSIIQSENAGEEGCEIYVNVSAGSPEYSSAATVASMMVPGTIPFSVGTQEYTVPTERIKDVAGLWYRDTESGDPDRKSTQRQTEAVYYQRDFITKWVRNGWVRKDDLRNKYVLTDDGVNVVNTFYLD